jgi:hypothetical protein
MARCLAWAGQACPSNAAWLHSEVTLIVVVVVVVVVVVATVL